MVKKVYFRFSITTILLEFVVFAGLVSSIYFFVFFANIIAIQNYDASDLPALIIVEIVMLFGVLILVYLEMVFLIGNIHLDGNRIYNRGDIRIKKEKIQYPTSVNLDSIAEVCIILSNKASNGSSTRLARRIPFLCVTKKNGRKAKFDLGGMTVCTVRRLLTDLKQACIECGNPVDIEIEKLTEDFSKGRFAI